MKDVLITYDYYAGGSIMPGRSFSANSYRYGYNAGSEKDDEITGITGSHFTTYFREGDTRLLIWWGVDPKADKQPWQSPYSYMDGNPIWKNDPKGDCPPGVDCDDPVEKVDIVSSGSSGKKGGIFGNTRGGSFHGGLDIRASKGTDLKSTLPGKVVYAKNNHQSDEYSGKRRGSGTHSPTTGYGNTIIVQYEIESDFNIKGSDGNDIVLKKGQSVYIQYTHMDKVDESLLGKTIEKGQVLGQAGATGNPGYYEGKWGIAEEDRHTHFTVGTKNQNGYMPKSGLVDPRVFIKTPIDDQGNVIENKGN
ncbi:MAG: hypothetical protein HS119_14500 [Flavobacteriales bacterium]|nr:hypothetical protein [Flavobacteriales bacterium]